MDASYSVQSGTFSRQALRHRLQGSRPRTVPLRKMTSTGQKTGEAPRQHAGCAVSLLSNLILILCWGVPLCCSTGPLFRYGCGNPTQHNMLLYKNLRSLFPFRTCLPKDRIGILETKFQEPAGPLLPQAMWLFYVAPCARPCRVVDKSLRWGPCDSSLRQPVHPSVRLYIERPALRGCPVNRA